MINFDLVKKAFELEFTKSAEDFRDEPSDSSEVELQNSIKCLIFMDTLYGGAFSYNPNIYQGPEAEEELIELLKGRAPDDWKEVVLSVIYKNNNAQKKKEITPRKAPKPKRVPKDDDGEDGYGG